MAKILKSILIFCSLCVIIPVMAQQNQTPIFKDHHPHKTYRHTRALNAGMSNYDMIYQRLNFNVNPSIKHIEGEVTMYYKALNSLDSLVVDLSTALQVDSVLQRNNSIPFLHQNNLLKIEIDDLSINIIDSLTVYYKGEPSNENHAFFIGVQDSINYVPVLATLSEPYGSSDWWPCKDNLSDKIDSIDINITCPIGNQAVSLGLLKNTESTATEITYMWEHRYPVTPYLVSITVSDYTEYHSYIHYNTDDSILFMNYFYHNDLTTKQYYADLTEDFFQVFDSLFTPYPFITEKYGHAEFPIGGGMEHQTISSMGRFDFEIVAHELAHQWFGDYITCNSWEDLWLNEGFATYCTGLCYENLVDGYYWPFWKIVTVDKITADSTGTVFPADTNDVELLFDARLTYRKASYILHMIRWTIGDENFFQAVKNYLNDEDLAFSFAKTPDLISYFETEGDTTLTEYMNDWFYGESYPIYNIEWSQDENQNFHTQINQSSALLDNHFFKLFVPLRLIGQNDTLDLKLNNQSNHQTFNISLNFEVDTVIFDPELWLISKNSSVELSVNKISSTKFQVYPNPCIDQLNIETTERISRVEIIDIKGESQKVILHNSTIDLTSFPQGVYFLKVETLENQYIKKLIKL